MVPEAGPLGGGDWADNYRNLAECVQAAASKARPVLLSTTVDVDDVYLMTPERLERLRASGRTEGGPAAEMVREVDRLLREGRDGELAWDWPEGVLWLSQVLGEADRAQVGGTGPQAAWALSALGAPSIIALERRSQAQLDALSPAVLVCDDGRIVPVRELAADTLALTVRNEILEFPGGVGWCGTAPERSQRIIVRFTPITLERDEEFMRLQEDLGSRAGAAVVAGINGLVASDRASVDWMVRLLTVWARWGPRLRHLELGDTTHPDHLKTFIGLLRGRFTSVGLSLSELVTFWGNGDVARSALELARQAGTHFVFVHADRWALAVHRVDRPSVIRQLMTGNLLASARAAAGSPAANVAPVGSATYSTDMPESRRLEDGWRLDCVPTPFVARPASTIGLGDTFTAGILLAAALQNM